MRKGLAFGLTLAGAMFFGGVALADGPREKYAEHMSKYYKHMAEAAEEADDGDWDDYYEGIGKARSHYEDAQFNRRIARPFFAPSRVETRTYYYGPRYFPSRTYTRRHHISYGPGCGSVTTYRSYSYDW